MTGTFWAGSGGDDTRPRRFSTATAAPAAMTRMMRIGPVAACECEPLYFLRRCGVCVQVKEMHLCGRALASGARSLMVPRDPNGCKTGRNSSFMQQFARYVCVKMLEFITASSLLWFSAPYRTTGT